MARTTKSSTKAAVLEDDATEAPEATDTTKATIEEAIQEVVGTFGVSVKRSKLKGLRALAYFAFQNAIEEGTMDALVKQTIANVDELPTGWTLERGSKAEAPAKPAAKRATKAAAKPAAAKAPAKRAAKAKAPAAEAAPEAKPAARRRPKR